MNNDLISRKALKKVLCENYEAKEHYIGEKMLEAIDNAPTVNHPNCDICEDKAKQYSLGFQDGYMTGKTRPQGEWWNMRDDDLKIADFKCSICKHWSDGDYNFCPNCGAKMLKGGAEE